MNKKGSLFFWRIVSLIWFAVAAWIILQNYFATYYTITAPDTIALIILALLAFLMGAVIWRTASRDFGPRYPRG